MTETISQTMKDYISGINSSVKEMYRIADEARKKGYDPDTKVEIPLAENMAERVEGLISAITPQIKNSGVSKRIHELEKKFNVLDWRIALIISEEVAKEKFCKFSNQLEAIETGIRIGFAYLTLGTVASPLEGFTGIKIRDRKDSGKYFDCFYSGPVRSAGGTAAAVSVVICDYLRLKFGYNTYDATEEEAKRMVTEAYDYHEYISNLQYLPTEKEIEFIVRNLPVQIDGEPSEKIEVSNYKDLARIETNRIRNGPCLVIAECVAQKAKKLWAQLSKWGADFGLSHWSFLIKLLEMQKQSKSHDIAAEKESKESIQPIYTFIDDLPAGRPVLTYPLRPGGFRLRYGRARTSGYSSAAISPSTMIALNNYIAIGTQLKTERPGKGTALSSCDSIEGPTVKLKSGDVVRVESTKHAKQINKDIEKILYLGDILISYGDFFNRAHKLVPCGYCEEWWVQDLEKATVDIFGNLDFDKLSDLVEIPAGILEGLVKDPFKFKPSSELAITLSKKLKMPIHPRFTYFWKIPSMDLFESAMGEIKDSKIDRENGSIAKIIIPLKQNIKLFLEKIGIPHLLFMNEHIIIEKDDACVFFSSLTKERELDIDKILDIINQNPDKTPLDIINTISEIKTADKAGTFIGARMGRPEKAKIRKLTGSPHVLFPVGEEGGRLRCFQSAMEAGKINSDFSLYRCNKCNKETVFSVCENCSIKTTKLFYCNVCGKTSENDCKLHNSSVRYRKLDLDINYYFDVLLKKLGFSSYPDLIKGVKGTSNKDHIPEHLIKGVLRAKHEIYVNKDGTIRYDMTQLVITHFRPREIGTPLEKLRLLGYNKDVHGRELIDENQVIEIKPQDVILPNCEQSPEEGADKILFRIANFIDELLEKLYGINKFYALKAKEDLIGHLVLSIAPHTSSGIVGRIIGFSRTQGFYAHPMFHAATRRDCDGDETSVILLLDALINFSRYFLPRSRGATQDSPLVLTSKLTPTEVDDMVFDMDVSWRYPLEFYNACQAYKDPWDIKIDQLSSRLNTEKQYEGFGFTHDTINMNSGVRCSAYKILPSMEEKLKGQMEIAERIMAVDESDVARLVIEKHFIRDIRGNLRKFSQQEFRCVKCNEKFRRPPLIGRCARCKGRIIFTVSQGSIIKYLEPAISLGEKYNIPTYLKQSLELTKRRVESIFGKEKEMQQGLGKWF